MNPQIKHAINSLREIEDIIRGLDDAPSSDAPPDVCYTNLQHNEVNNRVKITIDTHLSNAPGMLAAIAANCENLIQHYLNSPETTPAPPEESE